MENILQIISVRPLGYYLVMEPSFNLTVKGGRNVDMDRPQPRDRYSTTFTDQKSIEPLTERDHNIESDHGLERLQGNAN